jgi:hypothetical protein
VIFALLVALILGLYERDWGIEKGEGSLLLCSDFFVRESRVSKS